MNADHSGTTKSSEPKISPGAPLQPFHGASPVNRTLFPPLARFTTKQLDTFHPEDHLSPRRHFCCHVRAGCGQRKKKTERLCSRPSYSPLMISREKYVRAAKKTEFSPTFEGQPSVPGKSCKNNILIFIQPGLTAVPARHVLPEVIYIFSIYLQFITYNCNPFPVHRLALK